MLDFSVWCMSTSSRRMASTSSQAVSASKHSKISDLEAAIQCVQWTMLAMSVPRHGEWRAQCHVWWMIHGTTSHLQQTSTPRDYGNCVSAGVCHPECAAMCVTTYPLPPSHSKQNIRCCYYVHTRSWAESKNSKSPFGRALDYEKWTWILIYEMKWLFLIR
jgi:hypothetical protein